MHILIVGLNHTTASVELRERIIFPDDRLPMAMKSLRSMKSVLECVILSTCNRMELYLICDQLHTGEYYAKLFLEDWFKIKKEQITPYLYTKKELQAVTHLFQVVCGLDSLVLGETQILGQVRNAFLVGQSSGTTGTLFNTLFKQAITLGKAIHSETQIGQNAVSVGYAAVALGKKMFNTFSDKTILLIGTGKMSELTARHFCSSGAKRVIVVNRTHLKAVEFAKKFEGEARTWEQLAESLQEADIVVSSTSSQSPVLTRETIRSVLKTRNSPLFLIDIAVPRDIDPTVHQLENVFLYNIDDLHGIVNNNKHLRQQEVKKVQEKIEREKLQFQIWLETLGVIPLISTLREKAIMIQEDAIKRIERKLPHLTDDEKRVIRKQTKSILNQILKDPITRIKELASGSDKEKVLDLFIQLFALEESIKQIGEQEDSSSISLVSGKVSIYS